MLEIYSDLASKYGRDNIWVKWFKSELTDINDLEYPSIREYQTAFGKKGRFGRGVLGKEVSKKKLLTIRISI